MVKGHSLIIVSLVIGLVAIIYTCYNKTKKSNYELAYSYFPQGYYLGTGEETYALINQYSIDNEEANKGVFDRKYLSRKAFNLDVILH